MRVGVSATRASSSDTKNNTNDNANDSCSGERSCNSHYRDGTAIRLAEGASPVEAEVELALVVAIIRADLGGAKAALEWVAVVVSARVAIGTSGGHVDTTLRSVASIDSAVVLIVAVIGEYRGIPAANGGVALIDRAKIVVIASCSGVLPFAEIVLAEIASAEVAIITRRWSCALQNAGARRGLDS